MPDLVGRVAERGILRAALADGHGLVLLSGQAGIGKSALVADTADAAEAQGWTVLRGHAVDDPGAPPLWPWRRALRGRPELAVLAGNGDGDDAEPGGTDAGRFRRGDALAQALASAASSAPLLLVLEDLHWADAGSLHLVRHVALDLVRDAVVVLVTVRDGDPAAARVLPLLSTVPGARLLPLRGLQVDEVADWLPELTGRVGDAAALTAATGGNPLLVRLLAAHLGEGSDVAGTVRRRPDLRRLVLDRVAGLDARARACLDAASVLGERIVPSVLAATVAHATGDLSAELEACRVAGVLTDGFDGVRFEHALVRDAVYAELHATERSRLHARAAEALAALEAPAAPAAPIAMHWHRSSAPDAARRCCEWAERADAEARRSLAHEDAVRFAELAVDRARRIGVEDAELARLLVRLAEAYQLLNRFEDALAACVEAAEMAEAAGRGDLLAAAALVLHGVGHSVFLALEPICERALQAIDPQDDATRARLLAQLAVGTTETAGGPRGADLAATALAAAEASGDPQAQLEALAARHLAISEPSSVVERLDLGRRAVALGRTGPAPIAELWGHLWRASAAVQLGNLVEADREVEAIDRIARVRRSPLARWHHHRFACLLAHLRGDFAIARAANLGAFELGRKVGDISLTGMSYSFGLALAALRGDGSDMLPGWAESMRFAPPIPLVRLGLPIGHALEGDLGRARAEFAEFRDLAETFPVGIRWFGTLTLLGVCAVLLEDAEVADSVHGRFLPFADDYAGDGSGAVWSHGAVAGQLGDLARVAGRPADAVAHYRTALRLNLRIGAHPFVATTRLGWARALLELGLDRDPVEGHDVAALLDDAAAASRRLDMPGPLATALRLRADVPTGVALTAREAEVARLVAGALSNRQIAERLVVSERTVESHVRSILAKHGFTARAQIVAWMLQRR